MTELHRQLSEAREEAESHRKEADGFREDYEGLCRQLKVGRLTVAVIWIKSPLPPPPLPGNSHTDIRPSGRAAQSQDTVPISYRRDRGVCV